MARSALLLGASGLVGGHCLQLLLEDQAYAEVLCLVRRPLAQQHPKLVQRVVDFDHLHPFADQVRDREIFCCLGTTIKKAGSQVAFRRVDFDYPHAMAQLAAANGARQFLLITAVGADPNSRIFYNRVKGEVEAAIMQLALPALHILRPSLLLGNRPEFRLGESISAVILTGLKSFMLGPLRRYRPIAARDVAVAMIAVAKQDRDGVHVYASDRVQQIADDTRARS